MSHYQWLFAGLNTHRIIDAPNCYPNARQFTAVSGICAKGYAAELLFSCWSQLVWKRVSVDSPIVVKGSPPDPELTFQSGRLVKYVFGNYNGFSGYVDMSGRVWYLEPLASYPGRVSFKIPHRACPPVHAIAIAGNNRVAALWQADHDTTSYMHQFENIIHMEEVSGRVPGHRPTMSAVVGDVKQLAANDGVFVCLLANGTVLTWGDPRYRGLGRSPTAEEPAHLPYIVDSLGGIKITKVSAGDWTWAALSEDGAVYVCCPSGPTSRLSSAINKDTEPGELALVTITDVKGNILDFEDVAVGNEHILVLSKSGAVFGIGDNRNGQMGVGSEDIFFKEWKTIYPEGCSAVEAATGHSLIRVERKRD